MQVRPLSEVSTRAKRPCTTLATVFLGLALSTPLSLSGQTFQGQVTDGSSLAPVTGAFIRLVSEDGGERGSSITGTSGFYSIDAPQPGTYHLEVNQLGYESLQTSPVQVRSRTDVHSIDLVLNRAPVLMQSIVVSADRTDVQIRATLDIRPDSLRYRTIEFDEAEAYNWAPDLTFYDRPRGLMALGASESPCFTLESEDCLPVYPRRMNLNPNFLTEGLHGPYEEYRENGQLIRKATIRHGEVEGQWEEYYPNGQLRIRSSMKNGVPDGFYEQYDSNGQLQTKGVNTNGRVVGRWEEVDANGRGLTRGTMKNGEPDGPYEHRYANGQLQAKGTITNGTADGGWEEYYENGQIQSTRTYDLGENQGPYELYNENGQLQAKGTYKDGEIEGRWEEYYENGQLKTRGTINNGIPDGPYEHNGEKGRLK